MPFESEAQRRWMWATHPQMAREWAEHTPKGAKLPAKVGKKKPQTKSATPSASWLLNLAERVAGLARRGLD